MSRNDPPSLTDPYASDAPPSSDAPSSSDVPENAPPFRDAPAPIGSRPDLAGLRKERPSYELAAAPPTLPEGVSPFVAESAPAKKPKRARRKVPRRALAIAFAGVLGAGLVAGAIAVYLKMRAVPVAPCALSDLPKSTAYIERLPTTWVLLDVGDLQNAPPEAAWSHYAEHFCGGTDVFQNLLRSQGERQREAAAYALSERRDTGDALDCGKHLAEAHRGKHSYYVRLVVPKSERDADDTDDDDKAPKRRTPAWFAADRFTVDELPPTMRRYKKSRDRGELVGTHCLLPPGISRETDCVARSPAAARIDETDLFLAATLDHLEYFGRETRRAARKDEAELEAISKRVARYDAAVIGTHEGFPPSWVRRMGIAAPSSDADGTAIDKPLLEAIDDAEAHFGIGDSFTAARAGRFHLELVPRRAKDAAALADALEAWRKAFLDDRGREPDFEPLLGYAPRGVEKDYRAMVDAASVEALRTVEIVTKDGVVSLDVQVEYDDKGERLADEYLAELEGRAKLAATVVRQLYEGDKPDRDTLLELGGSELVGLMESPRLSPED